MIQKEIITASMVSAKTPSGVIGMPLTREAFNFNIMKKILLTQGKFALVDDKDYELLNQWKWSLAKRKNINYAQTMRKINGTWQPVLMHKIILNTPKGVRVDHKDTDGLNNQRLNLRLCSASQNEMNSGPRRGSSKYKGVTIRLRPSRNGINGYRVEYRSRITINRKEILIGCFTSEKDAALAYNRIAKQYFGEFAKLNLIN